MQYGAVITAQCAGRMYRAAIYGCGLRTKHLPSLALTSYL